MLPRDTREWSSAKWLNPRGGSRVLSVRCIAYFPWASGSHFQWILESKKQFTPWQKSSKRKSWSQSELVLAVDRTEEKQKSETVYYQCKFCSAFTFLLFVFLLTCEFILRASPCETKFRFYVKPANTVEIIGQMKNFYNILTTAPLYNFFKCYN